MAHNDSFCAVEETQATNTNMDKGILEDATRQLDS